MKIKIRRQNYLFFKDCNMDLTSEDLIVKLNKDKLVNEKFIKWCETNSIENFLSGAIHTPEKELNLKYKVNRQILTGINVLVSFLIQQDPESEATIIQQKILRMLSNESITQIDGEMEDPEINEDIVFYHKRSTKWEPKNIYGNKIIKRLDGNRKKVHVLDKPISTNLVKEFFENTPAEVRMAVIGWYVLMGETKKSTYTKEEIEEKMEGIENFIEIKESEEDKEKQIITIFIKKEEDYEKIKKKNPTFELSDQTVHLTGKTRFGLCEECSTLYQGWHPKHK